MGILGKISKKVKQSIEDIDWNEMHSQSDDAIQKIKSKTNEYKGDVLEKTQTIKEELGKKYKDVIGEKSYKKEMELDEREKKLAERARAIVEKEKVIKSRENSLNKNYSIPKVNVYISIVLIALSIIGVASSINFSYKKPSKVDGIAGSIDSAHKKPSKDGGVERSNTLSHKKPPKDDNPYSELERNVYRTYDGVDARDPGFDVGRYCLDLERRGVIGFDECLVISAAKILERNQ